jgi:hypothetical protein
LAGDVNGWILIEAGTSRAGSTDMVGPRRRGPDLQRLSTIEDRGPRPAIRQWEQFVPLFRKVAPKGAEALVVAARDAYLRSAHTEVEPVLARRSA